MSVINTNYLSLVAQNNLQKSQSALGTAIERLSSGLRINSAKDDAAGQAIANRMGAQINGLNQASRNANDGISAAQTTEGALNQINDNLQRIRVLTVQAANGTNSGDDLTSIQNEIGQRLEEINRISTETEFNGVKVLASDQELTIQVGANDGQTIKVNLQEINVGQLSLTGFNVDGTGTPNTAATKTDLASNGFISQGDGTYENATFNTAGTIDDVFTNVEDGDALTFKAVEYTYDASSGAFSYDAAAVADTGGAGLAAKLMPTGDDIKSLTIEGPSGGSVEVNVDSTGNITRKDDGAQLYFNATTGDLTENNTAGSDAAAVDDVATFLAASTTAGNMTITTSEGTEYTSTANADEYAVTGEIISSTELKALINAETAATQEFTVADSDATARFSWEGDAAAGEQLRNGATVGVGDFVYISGFDNETLVTAGLAADAAKQVVTEQTDGSFVDTRGNTVYATEGGDLSTEAVGNRTITENPLDVLDAALAQVDALRSDLGAIQNRFESAITNLQTTSNNLASAQSRIQDADYSVEVANMTRAQILQQAGTSVLAQANQIPQGVLSLLR